MKIVIEIGTEEQKRLIKDELSIIEGICEMMDGQVPICGIWVTENFDITVNELQGTCDYVSKRGHQAVGKNIHIGGKTALVFSRELYTDWHDSQTRMQFMIHELYHAVNREIFPQIPKESPSAQEYLSNLYVLYDDYWANRKSFEMVNLVCPEKSLIYNELVKKCINGFSEFISNTHQQYNTLKVEIESFRHHRDLNIFIYNTRNIFDSISKATVYLFSYIHHFKEYHSIIDVIEKSQFGHKSIMSIGNIFKNNYDVGSTDVSEGLSHLMEYMEKFAIKLEDREGLMWFTVLDI